MANLLFIYNPASGKGEVQKGLSQILDVFTKAGWTTTVYPTQCKGDAARVAKELGPKFDRVVCAGGDGTLSETVTGMMELEAPPVLGFIPYGSTNDCAATLDLPRDAVEAAATAAGEGVPLPCDVGKLNGSPFIYVAAFGAFTQVAYDTPQDMKKAFGHLAYVLAGIASLPTITPTHMRVEYDGQTLEDDFYFGMVSNAVSIGGIQVPGSGSVVLDDGLFEVYLVKKPVSLADVADGFSAYLAQSPASAGSLIHLTASRLTFTSDHPVAWTADGEYGGSQEVTEIVNCPRALTIIRGS